MNVVFLNDSCEIDGGSARIAIEDARQMASRGHSVYFFSACGQPPSQSDGIRWHSLGQRTILNDPNRLRAMSVGLWNGVAARALKELLKTLPRDSTVVHLHSWSKALSGSVVKATHEQGFRLVCTLHDYFAICPNGGLYDYPTRLVCRLRPMSVACMTRNCDSRARVHKIWRVVRQIIWRYVAGIPRHFDHVIMVSNFAAEKFSKHLSKNTATEVIENLPLLRKPVQAPLLQRRSIVYVGRVAAEKGADVYLEACHIAGIPAEVWGDGPVLPQLKAAWPLARFSGWLEPDVLKVRLQQALVLVVPSLLFETYGLVVAEAAAAGIAVIVSDHGAAAALVEDGVTGLYFRAGDSADLAEKMASLHADPARAYEMGQMAYNRFWQDYDARLNQRVEQIERCYQNVLGAVA